MPGDREPIARVVVAGLPAGIVSALRARLDGCVVLEAADDGELRERVRDAPDVIVLGDWALGDDPVAAVRRYRAGGVLSATKVVCCLTAPEDAALASQLIGELSVNRLLLLPLDPDEVLRQIAALAGATVIAAPAGSRDARASAGLAAVWARFRESTLRRIDVMDDAALALLDGSLSPAQRTAAQREAHKLAGAAGTFGFPRSSQIARQLEEQLSLDDLVPADAVSLSEQLIALRADLEGAPRALESLGAGTDERRETVLLLVGAEGALAERVESEGAARGLRVVLAADAAAARECARREAPAVVAVCIAAGDGSASLDLVATLAAADPPVPGLVLAPREATTVRIESARRGAQRFLELPASPASIVSQALALAGRSSAPPRRVLAVDDDPGILEALRAVLGASHLEVHTTDDPLRFWSVLEEVRPELLVLDIDMPHVSGIELARAVRNDPRWSHLPIILLTARIDRDTVRRAYAAGADDHIGKPLVAEELITRVRNRLDRAPSRDGAGETDLATGIGSRRRTADLIARFLHLARRRGEPIAVAAIAVEGVVPMAEAHGAPATELAWRAASQFLARALRGEDVVGRWSEQELVVALYGSSKADAARRLATLFATLARRTLTATSGASFGITCSAGIAQFPDDGADVEALREAASRARGAGGTTDGARIALAGSSAAAAGEGTVDVVIVDDDEALVALLEHALVTGGLHVHVFRDGESAAAGLLGDPPLIVPRVILLDVDLPSLNGLDLLRRLHRGGVTTRTRVVMLTARAGEQDVLTALSLGATDHVTKPFSVAVLLQKVRAALGDDG